MDSMVALFWILNPEKPWKVFVSNRVLKIKEISTESGISWKYCPTEKNLADLGSRGATIDKMERHGWFRGPDWLLREENWPKQQKLEKTKSVNEECKRDAEDVLYTAKREPDEWELVLARNKY